MPELMKKTYLETVEILVELNHKLGPDWQLYPSAQPAINKHGLVKGDLSDKILLEAERIWRERWHSQLIAGNADPTNRLKVVIAGHPDLDPERNPLHPLAIKQAAELPQLRPMRTAPTLPVQLQETLIVAKPLPPVELSPVVHTAPTPKAVEW